MRFRACLLLLAALALPPAAAAADPDAPAEEPDAAALDPAGQENGKRLALGYAAAALAGAALLLGLYAVLALRHRP